MYFNRRDLFWSEVKCRLYNPHKLHRRLPTFAKLNQLKAIKNIHNTTSIQPASYPIQPTTGKENRLLLHHHIVSQSAEQQTFACACPLSSSTSGLMFEGKYVCFFSCTAETRRMRKVELKYIWLWVWKVIEIAEKTRFVKSLTNDCRLLTTEKYYIVNFVHLLQ